MRAYFVLHSTCTIFVVFYTFIYHCLAKIFEKRTVRSDCSAVWGDGSIASCLLCAVLLGYRGMSVGEWCTAYAFLL